MMNGDKYSKCPIRHVLSLFSDKWSLLASATFMSEGICVSASWQITAHNT